MVKSESTLNQPLELRGKLARKCEEMLRIIALSKDVDPYHLAWLVYALHLLDDSKLQTFLNEMRAQIEMWIKGAESVNDYGFHLGLLLLACIDHHIREKMRRKEYVSKLRRIYYELMRTNKRLAYVLAATIRTCISVSDMEVDEVELVKSIKGMVEKLDEHIPPDLYIALLMLNELDSINKLKEHVDTFIEKCDIRNPQYCTLAALILNRGRSHSSQQLRKEVIERETRRSKPHGEKLSSVAENIARQWLALVLKGPWSRGVEPLPRQRKAYYEYDAVSIDVVEDRAEVHVAEVELECRKFLEVENQRTRIENKIARLDKLLKTVENAHRVRGIRTACIAEIVLICYHAPDETLKKEILSKAREALQNLQIKSSNRYLCPSFTLEKSLELYTGIDMIQKLRALGHSNPDKRLEQAIEYILEQVGKY